MWVQPEYALKLNIVQNRGLVTAIHGARIVEAPIKSLSETYRQSEMAVAEAEADVICNEAK